jgi:hypothetical protein
VGAKRQAKKEFEKQAELRILQQHAESDAAAKAQRQADRMKQFTQDMAEHARKLAAMTPEQSAAYARRKKRMYFGALALLVLSIGGCVVLAANNNKNDSKPIQSVEPVSDPVAKAKFNSYLRDNFSGSTWFSRITGVDVVEGSAYVSTDIVASGAASKAVCQGVSGWVFSNSSLVSSVFVLGPDGHTLVYRSSVSDSC